MLIRCILFLLVLLPCRLAIGCEIWGEAFSGLRLLAIPSISDGPDAPKRLEIWKNAKQYELSPQQCTDIANALNTPLAFSNGFAIDINQDYTHVYPQIKRLVGLQRATNNGLEDGMPTGANAVISAITERDLIYGRMALLFLGPTGAPVRFWPLLVTYSEQTVFGAVSDMQVYASGRGMARLLEAIDGILKTTDSSWMDEASLNGLHQLIDLQKGLLTRHVKDEFPVDNPPAIFVTGFPAYLTRRLADAAMAPVSPEPLSLWGMEFDSAQLLVYDDNYSGASKRPNFTFFPVPLKTLRPFASRLERPENYGANLSDTLDGEYCVRCVVVLLKDGHPVMTLSFDIANDYLYTNPKVLSPVRMCYTQETKQKIGSLLQECLSYNNALSQELKTYIDRYFFRHSGTPESLRSIDQSNNSIRLYFPKVIFELGEIVKNNP